MLDRRTVLLGGCATMITMPAAAADLLGVGMISRTFFYLPLWCATHAGFMKEEGLQIELKNPDTSAEVNRMLRAGECNWCFARPRPR
jgi:ABC-type nitrate/sulfonate/bicarbonate transport system substrate-binding protein